MTHAFDSTGILPANRIPNELQTITSANGTDYIYIVPQEAPFYQNGFAIVNVTTGQPLTPGVHYELTHPFTELTGIVDSPIFGSVTLLDRSINPTTNGNYRLVYQTVGGDFANSVNAALVNGLKTLADLTSVDWADFGNVPTVFPPGPHLTPLTSVEAATEIINAVNELSVTLSSPPAHIHLEDVEDLDSAYVAPLIAALIGIKDAIVNKTGGANMYHEIAASDGSNVSLPSVALDTWIDTDAVVVTDRSGSFKIDYLTDLRDGSGNRISFDNRFVVDNVVIPRSYSNGTILSLISGMNIRVQVRLKTTATDVFSSSSTHGSSLTMMRVGD